jgi:hypothetical protein
MLWNSITSAPYPVLLLHRLQVIGHAAAERLLLSGSMVPRDSSTRAGHC